MFSGCSNLSSVVITSFDTSNVERMGGMFLFCPRLRVLDLSSFDTSSAQYEGEGSYLLFESPGIERVTVGEAYSLPFPFSASGHWVNSSNVAFSPYDVPIGVADTYTLNKRVPRPAAATGLVSDGYTAQVGVPEGEGYRLSGVWQAVGPGQFQATATLIDGFIWEDESNDPMVINWSIAPEGTQFLAKPVDGSEFLYDGTCKTGVPENDGYDLSGIWRAVEPGEYEAVVSLKDGYLWDDGSSDSIEIHWSILEQHGTGSDEGDPDQSSGAHGETDAQGGGEGAEDGGVSLESHGGASSLPQTGDFSPNHFAVMGFVGALLALLGCLCRRRVTRF